MASAQQKASPQYIEYLNMLAVGAMVTKQIFPALQAIDKQKQLIMEQQPRV